MWIDDNFPSQLIWEGEPPLESELGRMYKGSGQISKP